MAIYKLNSSSIRKIQQKLENRANAVKVGAAKHAEWFLLNFGYHAKLESGPFGVNWFGWSGYYALNWNVSKNQPDFSITIPLRNSLNEKRQRFTSELSAKQNNVDQYFKDIAIDDSIYVLNSVYYGKWLNNGGLLMNTVVMTSHPNRFMELCEAHVKSEMKKIVTKAKKIN